MRKFVLEQRLFSSVMPTSSISDSSVSFPIKKSLFCPLFQHEDSLPCLYSSFIAFINFIWIFWNRAS